MRCFLLGRAHHCGAVAHSSFLGTENMLKLRKGFTLIELLIVVVIIGILAAIAIPKFANTKSKAYKTAMISDLRNLVTAEEAFFSDSGKYSQTIDSAHVKFAPSTGVGLPAIATGAGYWTATNVPHAADGRCLRHRHEHDEPDGFDGGRRRAGL